jgi:DNA-binding CsgD family transcriptional regulator
VFILGDILMFATTALVLSITCLCILLHVRSRDSYTLEFLVVLIPLCLQMCSVTFISYLHQVLPASKLVGPAYNMFCLWITLFSILLTSVLLYVMSRYLISLLPINEWQRKLGTRVSLLIFAVFLILSLFFIIGKSGGNWVIAMNLTFSYHFFSGSMIMVAHGITSLLFRKKASGHEQEVLLVGMSATFLPLIITFPLDLIFFKHHSFKLAYLSFAIYVVFIYLFISRRYFQDYETPCVEREIPQQQLAEKGISAREEEIIKLLVQGKTNREIAEQLFISINTVKTHVKNIYSKLDVSNRVQLFSFLRGTTKN